MCKLQCVEVHTLLKKSRLDLVIFPGPGKGLRFSSIFTQKSNHDFF